jgi:hypothetical protein
MILMIMRNQNGSKILCRNGAAITSWINEYARFSFFNEQTGMPEFGDLHICP